MIDLIAIDPGLVCTGLALFSGRSLVYAAPLQLSDEARALPEAWELMAGEVVLRVRRFTPSKNITLAYERPQVYQRHRKSSDDNDLIDVAGILGCIRAALALTTPWVLFKHRSFLPHAWKGNLEKKMCGERVRSRLSVEEKARVVSQSRKIDHNTLDAIGIGLRVLERFGPHTNLARQQGVLVDG